MIIKLLTNYLYILLTRLPDELWVQCDLTKCLKWRKLPGYVNKADLPDKWYCTMHPDPQWNSCSVPEEEENENSQVTPYEKKLKKRYFACILKFASEARILDELLFICQCVECYLF